MYIHPVNGRGFAGLDAEIGTKMVKFYLNRGYLTPNQIAVWRKVGKRGMRIAVYWKQLALAAEAKAKQETSFEFGANA